MMLFNGYLVLQNRMVPERKPKFSLKPGNYVSEEFRKEFDAWLAETFGYNACFFISESEKKIFVHPNNMYLFEKIPGHIDSYFPAGIIK